MDDRWVDTVRGTRGALPEDIERWAERDRARERREMITAAEAKMGGSTPLVQQSLRLLLDADKSWKTASGTVLSEDDEDVLDLGRKILHRERGETLDDGEDAEGDTGGGGRLETEERFVAAQAPFRLRLEHVRQVGGSAIEPPPELVIMDARGYSVVSGGRLERLPIGPERRIKLGATGEVWAVYEDGVEQWREAETYGYGMEGLPTLLRPARLVRAFDFHAAEKTVESGREAIRLTAVPSQHKDFVLFSLQIVVLGAELYSITIDASHGIVLAWEATIDGKQARGQWLSDVVIDGSIDERAFAAHAD